MKLFFAAACAAIMLMIPLTSFASPDVSAEAALLIDAETGLTLFEKNADDTRFPASTTKIMTAILAAELGEMDDILTASFEAVNTIAPDSSKIFLWEGENMSLGDLFYALIVASANDAANVIAEHIGGSTDEFVGMMNRRAAELGANSTHFVNAHGLHAENHYTTAKDLAIIARHAMSIPAFAEAVQVNTYRIAPTNKFTEERVLYSTNLMINPVSSYYYKNATGIKTGYTSNAGGCLVASAQNGTSSLISVVLCAGNNGGKTMSFVDSANLFEYGFKTLKPHTLVASGDVISQLPVKNARGSKEIVLEAAQTKSIVLPENTDVSDIKKVEYVRNTVKAPIKKGEMMGRMEYWLGDIKLADVEMLSVADYEKAPFMLIINPVSAALKSVWFYVAAVILGLIYFVLKLKKRRRHRAQVMQYRKRRNGI